MKQAELTISAICFSILALVGHMASAQDAPDITVEGIVRNEIGEPAAGVEVAMEPGTIARTFTSAEGTFSFQLPPGNYQVVAYRAGYEPVVEDLTVEAGQKYQVALTMDAKIQVLGEIDVTASYGIDRAEPVSTAALSGKEILELPNFGNDLLRAVAAIPGVTATEASAQFNVRGGLFRDTAIRLDGLEIFEPYHLKDFQGPFSIVDPDVIGSLDLIPGGFPAEYGDKMAGVLNMTSARPGAEFASHLGISITGAWASASGALGAEDETRWLVSGRRGYLDLILGLVDEDEEERTGTGPQYWDLIGKIEHSFSPSNTLTFNLLASDDSVNESETETDDFGFPERESIDSSYGNSYLWLNHQGLFSRRLFVDSVLSGGQVDRDRRATDESFGLLAEIHDIRKMDVFGLRQDWSAEVSDRHYLKWGFEARTYDVDYDYTNDFALDGFLGSGGLTRFVDSFSGEHYAAYVADRVRISPSLVLEVGARYDQQTLTDEDQISPRINLVYDLGRGGSLRAAFGQYYQSQRPNELQVEDGEMRFFPAERADMVLLGWERQFGPFNLRLDAYHRDITDPRPYYRNIFEADSPNPEATRDRILVAPEEATALGAEIFISSRAGKKFNWWGSYSWSDVTDRVDGRDVPRSYDQTHAVSLSATYRISRKWTINGIFNYHTGWPTTAVSGRTVEDPNGGVMIEPVIGPLNAERLDDYHRLDVRVSRFVEFRKGKKKSLELFLDIQNLYDRKNQAGFLVDERNFTLLPSGEVEYVPNVEEWLGILPSFGVGLRF